MLMNSPEPATPQTICQPLPESDYKAFAVIAVRAYAGMRPQTPEALARYVERLRCTQAEDPIATVYGAYRNGVLQGGMILYDFEMQMFSTRVLVGGVGSVAVDLLHRKEKLARDMLAFALAHYDEKNALLMALYPFRPDFYLRMGFGYGAKMYQYHVRPDALPDGGSKAHLRHLTPEDKAAVQDCYDRYMARTHGMMTRRMGDMDQLFAPGVVTVGYEVEGALQGYMAFTFERPPGASHLKHRIVVREMVTLRREALAELLTYLRTQADQVYEIVFNTQDDYFHHLLSDPRNGTDVLISGYHESHMAGVGLMVRALNVPRIFEALAGHDFGGVTCTLGITLTDSFYPRNAGRTVVRFTNGRPQVLPDGEAGVTITLDVAAFSSLVMGVVPFRRLYTYGQAAISNAADVPLVDRLFRAEEKPVCLTGF